MDALSVLRRDAAPRSLRRRFGPVLLALALSASASVVPFGVQAREWSGAEADAGAAVTGAPGVKEGLRLQRAQAWLRLRGPQRSRFFADLRALEEQDGRARLDLLTVAERCLERAREIEAVQVCQDQEHARRRELREAHRRGLTTLMSRYGLPLPPARQHGMGWRHRWGGASLEGRPGGSEGPSRPW